jgi:hypothetical protein
MLEVVKNLWESFKKKVNIFLKALLNFLYIFVYYLLNILKYSSFLCFIGFFIYFFKVYNFTIINETPNNGLLSTTFTFYSKDYLKYEGYLLANYIYNFKDKKLHIKSNSQKIQFFMNNNYYDEYGNIIKNPPISHITICKNLPINYITINSSNYETIQDGIKIYNYIKKLETLLNKEATKITLNYRYFRWDIIIEYENTSYLIKLPENINSITLKKIKYIENNIHKYFNKDVKIIDLRFDNNIITNK